MTALDQAFIKAYMHHGAAPVATSLSSAKPVCLAEALADPPKREPPEPPVGLQADSLAEVVVQALEKPPARARGGAPASRTKSEQPARPPRFGEPQRPSAKNGQGTKRNATEPPLKSKASQITLLAATPSLEELGISEAVLAAREQSAASAAAVAETVAPAAPVVPQQPQIAQDSVAGAFRPALQVDRFLWPNGCVRLNSVAGDQLEHLAAGITQQRLSNARVVGICGSRRGDGCTTLLLCAARRLVARGQRVILIDADFEQPVLPRRLGLLPELGWEDALWRHLPLAEVVIESVEDRMAVLPLRGTLSADAGGSITALDPMSDIALLRRQYDLVLIDLGRLDTASTKAAAVLQAARQWVDCAVVVHNVRTTPQSEVDYLRRRLREMGIAEAGVAENFV
jgi:Mrp family chromosome partitioning ATPase